MMRAELKWLHRPDVDDLRGYTPAIPGDFGFLLQAMIGPAGGEGAESFDMVVCTPDWLKRRHGVSEVILGQYHIIVFRYDYEGLLNYIARFAERCCGQSWQEIARQLTRLGKWEFDEYQE